MVSQTNIYLTLKFRRDPISPMLDLYDFKMALFNNVNPEGVLLFVCNFNMTFAASGILEAGAKYQYLRIIS